MRYRVMIALSILNMLVVAARPGAGAYAWRTFLADELDRASDVRGGAFAITVTGKGAG